MPFLVRDGIRLHYQVLGSGPPLVLHHGFASNLTAWQYFGFTQVLQAQYQLILLDARGHGLSDKPHTPDAYTLSQRVADVLALLDALGIARAHFFGYSMGGQIGYGLARDAPERLLSLIIGAAHPYQDLSWNAFAGIDGSDAEAFIAAFESVLDEALSADVKTLICANDLHALSAAAQQPRPSLAAILPTMHMPCLLFCGSADARHAAVLKTAQNLAHAHFASLPGLSHFGGLMRSDLVLPHVLPFLASMPAATP